MSSNKNIREYINRINAIKDTCLDNKTSYFVEHSEESTTVTNERAEAEQTVAIVLNDADGPDSAYVFGLKSTDLQVGDYLNLNDETYYFLYESVRVIKSVNYNKFKAYECNVIVNGSIHAYFVSSKTSPKDISESDTHKFETSRLLPVLVCPLSAGIAIDDQITINGQVWDVVELDDLTNPLIGYYTIERGTNTLSATITHKKDSATVLYSGTTFTLTTSEGYYRSDDNLEVVSRSAGSITFKVPKLDEVTVYTMINDSEVKHTYTVKESR